MKSVCCIMLANGRPEMVRRAVAAFHAQEYKAKRLLIWNTGERGDFDELEADDVAVAYSQDPGAIGTLRNRANAAAAILFPGDVDVFAHWDSDDWSSSMRLVEQMQLLENTRADLIGYRECLFWDTTIAGLQRDYPKGGGAFCVPPKDWAGSAWIYRNPNPAGVIGSSFLYPRSTWERVPFPPKHTGEDTQWILDGRRFKIHAVPSTWSWTGVPIEPRMICSIHGGNTNSAITPGVPEWKRDASFDAYCLSKMRVL